LIVPPLHADTILVPSGENATDLMVSLWAFVFSLSISSLSARQASKRHSFGQEGAI
jgi:tellurite resistance protein TehA-like permease